MRVQLRNRTFLVGSPLQTFGDDDGDDGECDDEIYDDSYHDSDEAGDDYESQSDPR